MYRLIHSIRSKLHLPCGFDPLSLASLSVDDAKSISATVFFGTVFPIVVGSHAQSWSVPTISFICFAECSSKKTVAAMCEQVSPKPAMQVQCPTTISPSFLARSHAFRGGFESDCECLTLKQQERKLDHASNRTAQQTNITSLTLLRTITNSALTSLATGLETKPLV